jgi:hypothetical protein
MTDHDLLMAAIEQETRTVAAELLDASRRYRQAKQRFQQRTRWYERQYPDAITAELRARDDYLRCRAVVDCEWFGSEMTRLGSTLSAFLDLVRHEAVMSG